MKVKHYMSFSLSAAFLCLMMTGCLDEGDLFIEERYLEEEMEMVHIADRDAPYPRESHELYINPSPLIVPESVKGEDDLLEFELSRDENFPEEGTFRSGRIPWNMYNAHQVLDPGPWYWRYRVITTDGTVGKWSIVFSFTVNGNEPVFVTPPFSEVKENLPTTFPRIHCYLDDDIAIVKPTIQSHPEYKKMVNRANGALSRDLSTSTNLYAEPSSWLEEESRFLYTACMLTDDDRYYQKMLEFGRHFAANPGTDGDLLQGNFYSGSIITVLSEIYDICYNDLTESEKTTIEDMIMRILRYYYRQYTGWIENDIFENHTWQHVYRSMFIGAFVLCHEYPEAMTALEYFYELWTARAPASGLNRDGGWINGTNYFISNVITLAYMPMILSQLAKTDFMKHPWYQNAGKAVVYSWLPKSNTTGFGDQSGPAGAPFRTRLAFADFIARETGDVYAGWYAASDGQTLEDITLRLYRMARSHISYGTELKQEEVDNFIWYKDMGEGVAFSDMLAMEDPGTDGRNNVSVCFRSSPFGSGSHKLADQNGFKMLYNGKSVYCNAGYYDGYTGANTMMHHKHTRGANSILVNGIGQPLSTKAYGNIERGMNSDHLAYFLGDASHAYCGIAEDWDWAYTQYGFAQTPAYGFGETPLTRYQRHLFLLRPNIVVVYDDLEASEPATWQWLLHSAEQFRVSGNNVTTEYVNSSGKDYQNFFSSARIYSDRTPQIDVTDEWFPGAEPTNPESMPNQWHMTASFGPTQSQKILAVIQVAGTEDGLLDVLRAGNRFKVGDWTIEAEMDGDRPATVHIVNETLGVVFDHGNSDLTINGSSYQRMTEGSSVLYDTVHGVAETQESEEKELQPTRSGR